MDLTQIPLDTLVVNQDDIKEIQCAICLSILTQPRQCRNGHLFCLLCIELSLKKSNKCPQCRISLSVDKLCRSLFLEKHLRNLNVFCKNHFKMEESKPLVGTLNNNSKNILPSWVIDEEGCNHMGSHENIETHELNCEYRFENCKYNEANNNGGIGGNGNGSFNIMSISTTSSGGSGGGINNSTIMNNSIMSNSIHGNCSGITTLTTPTTTTTTSTTPTPTTPNITSVGNSPIKKQQIRQKRHQQLQQQKDKDTSQDSTGNNDDNQSEDGGEDSEESSSSPSFNGELLEDEIINEDCGKIRIKDIENHYLVCPYRPITCGFCKLEFAHHTIKVHEINCDCRLVECTQCKQSIPKKETKSHLLESCPNQLISCSFGACDKQFQRKDQTAHLNESLGQHLLMMKQQHHDELVQLKKEFHSQINAKDEKIKSLEKQIKDKLGESKIKIEWKINKYSECKRNGYVQSEKFIIEGFPFFIGFFVDGDNNESKGYISIYLFLDTNDIPKGRSINTEFSLKFNNQKDSSASLNREYKASFPICSGSGWGDRKFIACSSLETKGFIKDNTLLVSSEVTIKKIIWQVEESQCDKL